MKIYNRILGILSGLILLAVLGLLAYLAFTEITLLSEWLIMSLFLIAIYVLLHFLIINRFGFNIVETSKKDGLIVILMTGFLILVMLAVSVPSLISVYDSQSEIEELEITKDLGTDSLLNFNGALKIKYVDNKLYYQLRINTPEKDDDILNHRFQIKLLDKDGFFIKEMKIENFSTQINKDLEVLSITANTSEFLDKEDYKRISNWLLGLDSFNNDGEALLPPPPKKRK
jgi:hypothetical protein